MEVDCTAGESVNDALNSAPLSSPVEITVSGLCAEFVVIARDDVTIQGATPADGFVPQGNGGIAAINGPSRVFLRSLTFHGNINNAFYSIGCFQGSSVQTENVTVIGGITGYLLLDGGQCRILEGVIDGAQRGINTGRAGFADLEGTLVTNSAFAGILLSSGGIATLQNSASGANTELSFNNTGISIAVGSHAEIFARIQENNSHGVVLIGGSTARIIGNLPIQDNGGNGISVATNSTLTLSSTFAVDGNGGWGLQCDSESTVVGNFSGIQPSNVLGAVDCP